MAAVDALDRLIAAIEAGDIEGARSCYADGARIWHNYDEVFQTVDENLRILRWMVRTFPAPRYVDIRRIGSGERAVEQHVLELDLPDGTLGRLHACVVVTADADDRITLLEEYLDPAGFATIAAAAGHPQ